MKILNVESIRKTFNDHAAVDNVSFALEEGQIFGLISPNGAGKTTTIRMIMNVIVPDSGQITVLGQPNNGNATNVIGYLPEERGMYRKMKVGELLLFLTKLKSMKSRGVKQQIDYWLNRLDIADWKQKKIEELSKGMQQKVQFIATILHKPKLLILDEPFGGLDPINANLIKDIIMELKQNGTTIIFSTHVMESAEKLCERIFLINKGKQVLHGALSDIKKQFGRQNVLLEYEGNDGFLKTSSYIKKFDNYGNYVEIQLANLADSQKLLAEAMAAVTIRKFEIKEPSLNDIFIETVNSKNREEADHE
ncbi:ATP-binding cassette domain-containing protein [candidate division KSB1 bacterium]|nr:ATP-binding cassette domain-containing protein [candidate division KSB1 bacterium]